MPRTSRTSTSRKIPGVERVGIVSTISKPPEPAGKVADPALVVTLRSTCPGNVIGTVTRIVVSSTTITSRPAMSLKKTSTSPAENPVPVMVIWEPDAAAVGATDVIVGDPTILATKPSPGKGPPPDDGCKGSTVGKSVETVKPPM